MKNHYLTRSAALAALALGLTARAATLNWDVNPGTSGAQDGAGSWDVVASNTNWWNSSTAANVVWNNATPDAAVFGATNGAAGTVTLAANIRAASLTFNPAGSGTYTVGGSYVLTNTGNLTANDSVTINAPVQQTGAMTWTVAGGKTLTVNGSLTGVNANLTFTGLGTGNLANLVGTTPSGILYFLNGGTWNVNGPLTTYYVWTYGQSNQTTTVNYPSGSAVLRNFFLGINNATAGGTNFFNMTGGNITCTGGANNWYGQVNGTSTLTVSAGSFLDLNNNYSALANTSFGTTYNWAIPRATLTINGTGLVCFSNANYQLLMTRNANTNVSGAPILTSLPTAIINLDGGTLLSSRQFIGNVGGNNGLSIFNFNGGLFKSYNASQANWITSLTHAYVRAGGAIIDDGGFSMGIPQALEHDPNGPAVDGGLTKLGAGTLTLGGANTYTGPTTISNGTLNVTGSLSGGGTVTICNGATLASPASISGNTLVLNGGTLAPGDSGGNGSLTLAGLSLGSGSADVTTNQAANIFLGPKIAAGAVAINGTNVINILGAAPAPGTWPLITFNSLSGSGKFVLGILPGGSGGYLLNTGSAIAYVVTNYAPETLVWMGTNTGNWSLSTTSLDWKGTTYNLGPQAYYNYLDTRFDDSSPSNTVNLVANVTPLSVTEASASNYTFKGTGAIIGATALTVNGPGMLTIANSNGYSGGTIINGGTLQVTNGGYLPGNINDNSVLVFNRSDAASFNGIVSGNGGLVKMGSGTLTLNNTNSYGGGTTVSNGTVALAVSGYANGEIGTVIGGITVMPGATLLSQAQDSFGTGTYSVSGLNLIGGALIHTPGNNLSFWGTAGVTVSMTGGSMSATNAGGRLDLGNTTTVSTYASPTASVIGGNSLYLRQNFTSFTVERGSGPQDLVITAPTSENSGGGISGQIFKEGLGIMVLAANNTYSGGTEIDVGTLQVGNGAGTGTLGSGPVANSGVLIFNRTNSYTFANSITGGGSLQQNGSGTVVLSGLNSYSGATVVSQGTLEVDGQLAGGGSLEVMTNATLAHGANGAGTYSTLNLDAGSTNAFVLGASSDTVQTPGGLTVNGPVVIQILNPLPPTPGIYNLIYYSGGIGGSGLGGLALALPPGSLGSATLQTNSAGTAIQLNLLNSGYLVWNGNVAGAWNLGGANEWKLGANPAAYSDGNSVQFDDTAATFTVNLTTTVQPTAVVLSAAGNYAFTGPGVIAGRTALTQNGPGTLTVANTNSYTGGTTIAGGALQLTNTGVLVGSILDNGLLVFNRSDTGLSFSLPISGSGAVLNRGPGIVTLSGANTYGGGTTVSAGTLQFVGAGNLGAAPAVVTDANTGTNNAALLAVAVETGVGGRYTVANDIVVGGNGAGTVAIGVTNSGSYVANSGVYFSSDITLNTNVSFLGWNGDMYVNPASGKQVHGTGNITCAGTYRIMMNGIGDDAWVGDILVNPGAAVHLLADRVGATRRVDLGSNATLMVQDNVIMGALTGSGNVAEFTGHTGYLTVGNGDVSFTNAATMAPGTYNGLGLAGDFGLVKVGQGTYTWNGAGSYTLPTVVSNGTLLVNGALSTASGVTVVPGATLGGYGVITGPVTNYGTLAPGGAGIGTLATGWEWWAPGGLYACQISNATAVGGCDLLNVTGVLDLEANASSPFTIRLSSVTASNTPGPMGGFNQHLNYTWTIASASSGVLNFDPASLVLDTSGIANDTGGGAFSLSTNGSALVVKFVTSTPLVPPTLSGAGLVPGGGLFLTFNGPSGQTYTLLTSTNVAMPLANWTTLATGTFTGTPLNYTNSPLTNACQFYRLSSP